MKNPTTYLKMRVLGAIETAGGDTIIARIKNVSQMSFTDEDGFPRSFTWRTIQTWYSRFKKHGVTVMENTPRSDRGKTRKVNQEQLLEAIRAVLPSTHTGRDAGPPRKALLYPSAMSSPSSTARSTPGTTHCASSARPSMSSSKAPITNANACSSPRPTDFIAQESCSCPSSTTPI
jgi:hypothetical protein